MMTHRWLNYVLSVVVVAGLVAVAVYERPRLAEERAELLDQEVVERAVEAPPEGGDRNPMEFRAVPRDVPDDADREPNLGDYGVSAGHEAAVAIGMEILEAGGNAVDAAIAVAYALAVAEPFGSGIGGGGAMLLYVPGESPVAYDYREAAPIEGDTPSANIGVPGFVAGMEHVHAAHGTIELADLIEPAARLAEDGVEVTRTLNERLQGAAHRLPIHLLPELFPNGGAIGQGETLFQPAYAESLRLIQEEGATAMYEGELAEAIADEVSGLEVEDLAAYEVQELAPAIGRFAGYEVVSGPPATSGPTLVQILQVAEALGIADLEPDSADAIHTISQAWRVALSDRTEYVADVSVEDVPLDMLLGEERTSALASAIPPDGFAAVDDLTEIDARPSPETDTTHLVVVDDDGVMVSMTNTLRNFFGSGQPVRGFFLNDQLANFSSEPDSINQSGEGKRPRSFITPTILAQDGRPVLGIGSAGGRRIPTALAQVVIRWAAHGQDLDTAGEQARFHLEDTDLEVEARPSGGVVDELRARGYEIVLHLPTPEYFGALQALLVDHDDRRIEGVADHRRDGTWDAASR